MNERLLCVCSLDVLLAGLQKSGKSIRSGDTFQQRLVTVDFDDISLEKYGQLII